MVFFLLFFLFRPLLTAATAARMIASILLSFLFLSFLCLFVIALFRGRALDGHGFSPTGKTELKVPKPDSIAARPRRTDIKVDQPPLNVIIQAE